MLSKIRCVGTTIRIQKEAALHEQPLKVSKYYIIKLERTFYVYAY